MYCNYKDTKILDFSQYKNLIKHHLLFTQYIIENIDGCENNRENLSTTKVSEHIPSGFKMTTISSFGSIKNKHNIYRGKDCMKNFFELLRKHAMKIINFKKKKNEIINKRAAGTI